MSRVSVPYATWTTWTARQRHAFKVANPAAVTWGDDGTNAHQLDADGLPVDPESSDRRRRTPVTLVADCHHDLGVERVVIAADATKVPARQQSDTDDTYRQRLAAAYEAEITAERERLAAETEGRQR